jgi:hypothetical protein
MKSGYDPAQVMGLMVQSVSVHFSPGQESPPRRVMRIEEPFCDDVIRTLLKVDGPALPAWLADRASRGTAEAPIQAVDAMCYAA